MRSLSQLGAVLGLMVRTLPQRVSASLIAVAGVAGVVVVLVAVLSIAEGFRAAMVGAGSADVAIVMRGGSDSELSSTLEVEPVRIAMAAPGVRRTDAGPLASAELFVVVEVSKLSTGTAANVPLRGVGPAAFSVRDNLQLAAGRRFRAGTREVIVGRAAAGQFAGLELGDTPRWGEQDWTVVGIFEAEGSVAESEVWADASIVQSAYRRGSAFQSVRARLQSPAAFAEYRAALESDPRLSASVVRESDYFLAQSQALYAIVTTLGMGIAVLMAIGAVFGAVNTMYAAVASRTREIATLRALGFGALPVTASILAESVLVCLAGGVVGGAIAYFGFNGYQTATLNWQTFSQVAFAFRVTPELLLQGCAWAVVLGVLGGLLPAARAARLPIAPALREL